VFWYCNGQNAAFWLLYLWQIYSNGPYKYGPFSYKWQEEAYYAYLYIAKLWRNKEITGVRVLRWYRLLHKDVRRIPRDIADRMIQNPTTEPFKESILWGSIVSRLRRSCWAVQVRIHVSRLQCGKEEPLLVPPWEDISIPWLVCQWSSRAAGAWTGNVHRVFHFRQFENYVKFPLDLELGVVVERFAISAAKDVKTKERLHAISVLVSRSPKLGRKLLKGAESMAFGNSSIGTLFIILMVAIGICTASCS